MHDELERGLATLIEELAGPDRVVTEVAREAAIGATPPVRGRARRWGARAATAAGFAAAGGLVVALLLSGRPSPDPTAPSAPERSIAGPPAATLPAGWGASPGRVENVGGRGTAWTLRLTSRADPQGGAVPRLGPGDVALDILIGAPGASGREPVINPPVQFTRADFPGRPLTGQRAAAVAIRSGRVGLRTYSVRLALGPTTTLGWRQGFPPDADELIAEANGVLLTMRWPTRSVGTDVRFDVPVGWVDRSNGDVLTIASFRPGGRERADAGGIRAGDILIVADPTPDARLLPSSRRPLRIRREFLDSARTGRADVHTWTSWNVDGTDLVVSVTLGGGPDLDRTIAQANAVLATLQIP